MNCCKSGKGRGGERHRRGGTDWATASRQAFAKDRRRYAPGQVLSLTSWAWLAADLARRLGGGIP